MDSSDSLRSADGALRPDPRMQHMLLDEHCRAIRKYGLTPNVPESVCIHFETAKNLYLYSWFVYRFHMVAEQYVYSTLELALREKLLGMKLLDGSDRARGLSKLLKIAREADLVSNERFTGRQKWATQLAHNRYSREMSDYMFRENLTEIVVDYSSVVPNEEDLTFDWLDHFIRHLPIQRNLHAHGTDALYQTIGWTFEVISELINQLYSSAEICEVRHD